MLEINNVTVSFGGLKAVNDFSMQVKKGEIHALIGPNGAGKTTLFNTITRIVEPQNGKIEFKGENLLNLKTNDVIYKGISRTFQNLQLFQAMNVFDNIYSGIIYLYNKSIFSILSKFSKNYEEEARERVLEIAEIFEIKNRLASFPAQLPYGILKRVELARAIASDPELLLLDEPAAGLNNYETEEIKDIIKMVNERGKTILLVEHDMNVVMNVSNIITVMNFGKKIAEGVPKEISKNEEVIKVYLGEEENA
ncbi:ABC transporter ATP-binding protein [Petrotoga sp. 9PWA.NaAc.5.4]|uniref:ABC transporter ATP-binding protein n=1 Tax=Petrotoga sp. 9PWA.NaAc.5.4 TaxID=1434328 RepID=UPI000CBCD050|nr:ABC transporter ATP-binding protein [Petrotoga sp. 9PWA.NaAc.5.4]PNR96795.1 branched-chain amino acid ABC transporter ATP-binding protein [Petrotoga sp. 9PWA.NaAc.5.4]